MDNLIDVDNANRKPAISKIHEVIQIDCNVMDFCDLQNPIRAVIPAIRCIVNMLGHEQHEQQGLYTARELLWGNEAQYSALNGIRTQDLATVDRLDHPLSKLILKPLKRLNIVKERGGVVDDTVHIAVVNREHGQPF